MSEDTPTDKNSRVHLLTSKYQAIETYETRKYAQFLYSVKETLFYFRHFLCKHLSKSHNYFWTQYVLSQ